MIVAICAGGPIHEVAFSLTVDKWIGVDRGAFYLMDHHIIPDAIVGDFDSVTADEFARISEAVAAIEQFQPEKDETDTDLALLHAIQYNPTVIYLTGVTGGRLDHRGGHYGSGVLQRPAAPGDEGRGQDRGPRCEAHRQRADGGVARVRPRQEEEREDRGL